MYHEFTYEAALASSLRAQWKLDDVLREDQELDFTRNFLPESLARTACLTRLSADEQRALNQISAYQYMALFGAIEEFVLPFVLDHARPMLNEDDFRVRALLNFACEEAKHIQLFKRYQAAFERGFPVVCQRIGPRELMRKTVLANHPLTVALLTLMFEWLTQEHYLGSLRDDTRIDPLFKSLLKHHWMEEAQHAKLDTLMVEALAEGRSHEELATVTRQFFTVLMFFDESLRVQAKLNVEALERLRGGALPTREQLIVQQHKAARWTYIGMGMVHERFRKSVEAISPKVAAAVAAKALSFRPVVAAVPAAA